MKFAACRLIYYIIIILSRLISTDSSRRNSIENFCKPRGPQHKYYYIVVIIVAGMKMRTRKEVHWRITKTPKRGVTSRDRSLGREQ